MNALLQAVEIVLPVVLMLGLGCAFARWKGFTTEQSQGVGKLVYWICLPTLIFRDLSRANLGELFEARTALGAALTLIVTGVLGYRWARWRGLEPRQVGVFAQAVFRSNMVFVGLPILLYQAVQSNPEHPEEARTKIAALGALCVAVSIPILNAGAILFLALANRHASPHPLSAKRLAVMLATNPLVLGVLAGLLAHLLPAPAMNLFAPTSILGKTVELAASAALPMALFSVGAGLDPGRAWVRLWERFDVLVLKLLFMPALGLALLWALGVRGPALTVGVIMVACPTAAASHALAVEMDGDEILAGDLVALTTMVCPITIVGWLAVLNALS